tara:strand:- start:269 stop:559 length:291 start_codon:yes stop_codon:yes gene_type:complete
LEWFTRTHTNFDREAFLKQEKELEEKKSKTAGLEKEEAARKTTAMLDKINLEEKKKASSEANSRVDDLILKKEEKKQKQKAKAKKKALKDMLAWAR